jgi:hypothetical protein
MEAIVSPLPGLVAAKVSPLSDATHWPPMNIFKVSALAAVPRSTTFMC